MKTWAEILNEGKIKLVGVAKNILDPKSVQEMKIEIEDGGEKGSAVIHYGISKKKFGSKPFIVIDSYDLDIIMKQYVRDESMMKDIISKIKPVMKYDELIKIGFSRLQ